jgi:peptidyl-prolyl cis-trans isomerase C
MMLRNSLTLTALALCAALGLAACNPANTFKRAPEPGDVAVATVNGQKVWSSDVKREAVAQGLIGEGEPLDTSSDLFRQVLDEVVDQKLLAAEAIRRKVDKQALAQRRIAAARERILGDMLVESTVSGAVNDRAIQNLYSEQLRLSRRSDEIRARQIVTRTPAEGEAVRKLVSTGAAFETLAMDKSVDPNTRFNGGDLGYFTLDVMPAAYGQALKDAKVGDLVGPFQVEGGFALVRVEDRRQEKPISLEQARPQIVRFLTYDEVRGLLERLRAKAKVKVLLAPARAIPGAPREPASAPAAALRATPPAPAPMPEPSNGLPLPGALPAKPAAPAATAPGARP